MSPPAGGALALGLIALAVLVLVVMEIVASEKARGKRREVEQDAEYQAFLDKHQKKPVGPPTARAIKPAGNWKWDDETCEGYDRLVNGVNQAYRHSAVSYGPVDELSSATYVSAVGVRYPDQAND